jgi:type II secretory pathway pseudopilin PulG
LKLPYLKSKNGFSIMEVMVAAGLLGIVTIGVMQLTRNMTKSEKSQSQQTEFNQIQSQIQSLLRDEYSCEASLLGFSPSGSGTSVTQVKRKKSDGTTAVVFETGQSYGSPTSPIFLKSMAIKKFNASSGIGEFYIEMNKGRKDFDLMNQSEKDTVLATSYGTAVVSRTIKLNLVLDGSGNIKDCVSDKDDFTSGTCGMLDGDWTDKVKCKSINVQGNGIEPSITAETNLHVKSGLNVGSTLSGDPGDGNATFLKNIDVRDKAMVKNDTTITTGKLIFNDGDASISQVAGSNLYVQNKAGTGNANLIVGRTGNARTTVTPTSVTVNKNGTIGAGLALEVIGNTTLTGSGSTSVTLKVGNADIQYNGSNLVLNKPGAGVVQYKDGSTIEEVATQGFVNAQLGKALTGDPTTLNTLLSNLATVITGNPIQSISASVCGFYTNMAWNGTRCVDTRTANCPGNQMVKGFNSGNINCQPAVGVSQSCPAGQILTGFDGNGTKQCSNADNQIGNYVDTKINAALGAERARTTCTGGQAAGLCIVNGTTCPSGTSRVGNWGTTSNKTVCGGSTTGCGGCGNTCNTGNHGFSNAPIEGCCASKKAACGPATSGSTCGNATLTQVGCTMP